MAQHYSIKDFFRQMPNPLLARYFKTKGLFSELDFVAMKEGKPDELFAAWLELPEGCKPLSSRRYLALLAQAQASAA